MYYGCDLSFDFVPYFGAYLEEDLDGWDPGLHLLPVLLCWLRSGQLQIRIIPGRGNGLGGNYPGMRTCGSKTLPPPAKRNEVEVVDECPGPLLLHADLLPPALHLLPVLLLLAQKWSP
jgi:hypothetical protein